MTVVLTPGCRSYKNKLKSFLRHFNTLIYIRITESGKRTRNTFTILKKNLLKLCPSVLLKRNFFFGKPSSLSLLHKLKFCVCALTFKTSEKNTNDCLLPSDAACSNADQENDVRNNRRHRIRTCRFPYLKGSL